MFKNWERLGLRLGRGPGWPEKHAYVRRGLPCRTRTLLVKRYERSSRPAFQGHSRSSEL